MDNENNRGTIGGFELARWGIVALLIVVGVVLFFTVGGRTRPVVEPSNVEAAR